MSEEKKPADQSEQIPELVEGYRALHERYRHYHAVGPKDIAHGKPEDVLFHVQIQRASSAFGEQLAIQVPVFSHDSRKQMRDRLQVAYSIMQERMEDENEAINELTKKAQDNKMAEREAIIKAQQEAKIKKLIAKGKLKVAPQPEEPTQG